MKLLAFFSVLSILGTSVALAEKDCAGVCDYLFCDHYKNGIYLGPKFPPLGGIDDLSCRESYDSCMNECENPSPVDDNR